MKIVEKPFVNEAAMRRLSGTVAASEGHSALIKTPRLIGSSGWNDKFKQTSDGISSSNNRRFDRSGDGRLTSLSGSNNRCALAGFSEAYNEQDSPRVACLRAIREAYKYHSIQQQQQQQPQSRIDGLNQFSQTSTGFSDKSGIKKIFGM